jgi:hypothetical protein
MMAHEDVDSSPRCPRCTGELVCIGSRDVAITDDDSRVRHAYWCPAGCRGPEQDGTFGFFECPACGSHDTLATPRDGVEEIECNCCGTIMSISVGPSAF